VEEESGQTEEKKKKQPLVLWLWRRLVGKAVEGRQRVLVAFRISFRADV
jgi:hypothetical protein